MITIRTTQHIAQYGNGETVIFPNFHSNSRICAYMISAVEVKSNRVVVFAFNFFSFITKCHKMLVRKMTKSLKTLSYGQKVLTGSINISHKWTNWNSSFIIELPIRIHDHNHVPQTFTSKINSIHCCAANTRPVKDIITLRNSIDTHTWMQFTSKYDSI